MDINSIIRHELLQASDVLDDFLSDNQSIESVAKAADLIVASIKAGGKLITCGNGGSQCDAMHMAEELTGRFRGERKPFPAVAISDPSYISCVGNDYGFEHIYSRFVEALGNKGDVLVAISTSGKSKNVLNAIKVARNKGVKVLGLTGNGGGEMGEMCDHEIRVPYFGYADRIQELHIKIIHILILLIEKKM